ncbi:type II secretion system F family protein [Mangrovibacillus cuniculi]|uniref:Type II secretion system protein GspF domain-containing protein n=1 Tax=Mangrovibacillus cuniculi TaxID=2593652 RepID=A0A7S8CE14_9BACI|nr:type II secretion system F family protein [Mangrovibacillus cuniculi]QPC48272.1 hypothetical protein G8O30_15770 [Mangrovibacillus cuniculi]
MIPFLLTTLSVFLALIGVYFWLDYRKGKKEWRKEISHMYNDGEKRKSFLVVLGAKFDQTESARPIEEKLRAANIPFTPSEYIGALIVTTFGVMYALTSFFSVPFPMSLFIAILLVEGGKRVLFYVRRNKMKQQIVEQLPEVCRTLANATRSGMTLTQGINLVAQEVSEPAKGEFKRLANELSLGVDFTTALRAMEKRMENKEFKLFVATMLIQKKAGGNLYAVLDEMSQTLDERKLILQEIKTMTAEQRFVSYIVPVIPIFLILMMNNIIDGFIDPLFTGLGLILLILFVSGTILTFVLVRKVTNIKV